MFVKPGMHRDADGELTQLVVRLPNRQPMPSDGMDVDENDLFYARLLRDGDIVPAKPLAASPPASPPAPAPKAADPS